MAKVARFVDNLIKTKKVAVFLKTYCPYCAKAKSALTSLPLKETTYEWIEIDQMPECDAIQDYLGNITGSRFNYPRLDFYIHPREDDVIETLNKVYNLLTQNGENYLPVPRVFIDGKFFGGSDDTVKAKENGKLAQLLKSCGAID